MSALRQAPTEIRLLILDALQDPTRRFFDRKTSSRNDLDLWDIPEKGFFAALCEDLRIHEIFLKPKDKPSDPLKYQTRLIYEANPPDYLRLLLVDSQAFERLKQKNFTDDQIAAYCGRDLQ